MAIQLFGFEQSKAASRTDIVLYVLSVFALVVFLFRNSAQAQWLEIGLFASLGLISWTLIEYALHRFVLHRLQPFRGWHEEHHRRPTALIFTPTILSATLICTFVFIPMLLLGDIKTACEFTLGILIGYLAYTVTHHAVHHWHTNNLWLKQRKRWHAQHHYRINELGFYGVTSSFWDYVFGTFS